ncbi:hypothetical protein [Haladaptatus sp. ZSTT2]|uniref:hypothetical protein n=1 Tax=Haladaptatus sp. ZSTT2 TaxID=3120515 RepID=UPI00300EF66C
MASHGVRDQSGGCGVPFDIESAHRLSCELGEYLTEHAPVDQSVSLRYGTGKTLTAYTLTEHSCVVKIQTPVGRLRFFELPRDTVEATIDRLRRDDWRQLDSGA